MHEPLNTGVGGIVDFSVQFLAIVKRDGLVSDSVSSLRCFLIQFLA